MPYIHNDAVPKKGEPIGPQEISANVRRAIDRALGTDQSAPPNRLTTLPLLAYVRSHDKSSLHGAAKAVLMLLSEEEPAGFDGYVLAQYALDGEDHGNDQRRFLRACRKLAVSKDTEVQGSPNWKHRGQIEARECLEKHASLGKTPEHGMSALELLLKGHEHKSAEDFADYDFIAKPPCKLPHSDLLPGDHDHALAYLVKHHPEHKIVCQHHVGRLQSGSQEEKDRVVGHLEMHAAGHPALQAYHAQRQQKA